MEKYINMNDSFGWKNTVSSTKSYQTSFSQDKLQKQVENYSKALKTAEKLVESYMQENVRLNQQNKRLSEDNERLHQENEILRQQNMKLMNQNDILYQQSFDNHQKYTVLEHLFIKLNNQKQKQYMRRTKRYEQIHQQKQQVIKQKYEKYIKNLNEKIKLLEKRLFKTQQKQNILQFDQCSLPWNKKSQSIMKMKNSKNNKTTNQGNPEILLKICVETQCSPAKNKDDEHQILKTQQYMTEKYQTKHKSLENKWQKTDKNHLNEQYNLPQKLKQSRLFQKTKKKQLFKQFQTIQKFHQKGHCVKQ